MTNETIHYHAMFKTMKPGVTAMWGEPVEVIGEQTVELEDGTMVEQYLYNIFGNPARNGKPYAALKSNIELTEVPVELPPVTYPTGPKTCCEGYGLVTKTVQKLGKAPKTYKRWVFIGFATLPNLRELPEGQTFYIKNNKLHIVTPVGTIRYHIQEIAEF